MEYAKARTGILLLLQVQHLLYPPVINQLIQACIVPLYCLSCPSGLLIPQLLGLAADAESHSLTPGWLPGSKVPPTVTVSHPSLSTLDPFATQAVSGSPPHQQPTTKPLNIPKVDDRLGTDAGLSTSPASLSASPSNNYPPNGSSATSPLETITPSSRSGQQSLAQPQAIGRELRVTLPEEAKQYTSSVADSPADSPLARAIELNHGRRGLSPTRSNAPPVPDPRDSATDKSMRRDLSDGEFLDLDDSDSLYDSAADYSLTSPSPQDSRKPPDDPKQPRVSIQSPAADDFPLPPGIANPGNPVNSNLIPGTSQATPAVERARRMDGPESPTTPTPNAYGSRLSTYQSVIPEQESLVQFRALPLLPYDLPYTNVTVTTSSIRPNDRGKDVLSFVVLVNPGNQKDPYMVEKLYSDVLGLDQRIRSRYGKIILKKIPHLPDGKLWRDHAPSKVDQRKVRVTFRPCVKNLISVL
jgi:RalA-binding protein 1